MILPNFLIVGAQKCGTTSLHDILKEHPQTNVSKINEINFFSKDTNYIKGESYNKTYFDDPDHLNIYGAEMFTKELSEAIQKIKL